MDSPPSIVSWPSAIAGAVLASLGAIFGFLIKRKKLPAEIHKTEADAEFTQAQADDLRFKTRLSATEMFSEMAADLGELQFEKLQWKSDKLQLEKDLAKKDEQIHVLESQVQEYKAIRMLEKLEQAKGE